MIKAAVLRRQLTDDQRAMISVLWARENKIIPIAGPGRGHIENNKTVAPRSATVLLELEEQSIVDQDHQSQNQRRVKTKREMRLFQLSKLSDISLIRQTKCSKKILN